MSWEKIRRWQRLKVASIVPLSEGGGKETEESGLVREARENGKRERARVRGTFLLYRRKYGVRASTYYGRSLFPLFSFGSPSRAAPWAGSAAKQGNCERAAAVGNSIKSRSEARSTALAKKKKKKVRKSRGGETKRKEREGSGHQPAATQRTTGAVLAGVRLRRPRLFPVKTREKSDTGPRATALQLRLQRPPPPELARAGQGGVGPAHAKRQPFCASGSRQLQEGASVRAPCVPPFL